MIKIAHRGNIAGPNPERENTPEYIEEALEDGFDVEVDVWLKDNKFYLGHDKPQYKTTLLFLYELRTQLWVHAKNIEVLPRLLEKGINCFWHQADDCTLTNEGYIWTYPGKQIAEQNAIAVMPELVENWDISKAVGICSDFVNLYEGKKCLKS